MASLLAKQAARARREARQRGLRADLSLDEWSKTVEDFGWKCAFCGGWSWTLDHFIPLSDGGSSSVGNCVPSCPQCNHLKGSLPVDYLWFIPQERVNLIRLYLHRRSMGLRGWPPPLEPGAQERGARSPKKKGKVMSTKDMQYISKTLAKEKKILLYWDSQQVVLQLRHQVAAEDDIMIPSVRVAVALTPPEAVSLAGDLLRAVSPQLEQMQQAQQPASVSESASPEWKSFTN